MALGALVYQRNNLVLISVKPGQNFSLVYIIMAIVISFLMEQKSLCLMPIKKNVNFLTQFCLRSICNGFGATDSRKVSLKRKAYNFSVDYHWWFWHIKHSEVFCG